MNSDGDTAHWTEVCWFQPTVTKEPFNTPSTVIVDIDVDSKAVITEERNPVADEVVVVAVVEKPSSTAQIQMTSTSEHTLETMITLALLNAGGKPLETQELFNFFITHFTKLTVAHKSWKAVLRNKLFYTPHKFTTIGEKDKLNAKYKLNLTETNWVREELNFLETRSSSGEVGLIWNLLTDKSVWSAMKAGTLGLPPTMQFDGGRNLNRRPIQHTSGAFRSLYSSPKEKKTKYFWQKHTMEFAHPVVIALALHNSGGRPLGVNEVNKFILTHFPAFTVVSRNWRNLSGMELRAPRRFTKIDARGVQKKYKLNLSEANWVEDALEFLESSRFRLGASLDWYGLADESVWDAMKAGKLLDFTHQPMLPVDRGSRTNKDTGAFDESEEAGEERGQPLPPVAAFSNMMQIYANMNTSMFQSLFLAPRLPQLQMGGLHMLPFLQQLAQFPVTPCQDVSQLIFTSLQTNPSPSLDVSREDAKSPSSFNTAHLFNQM